MSLLRWLELPEVANSGDLDDRERTLLNARIIRKKRFLSRLYEEFYQQFRQGIAGILSDKVLVELGSGGGFLKELIPNVLTTDILELPGLDHCFSVLDMPFDDGSVDGFFLLDVMHHVPHIRGFLRELERCLCIGGRVVMIEPANTIWGRFIYQHFHPEPFDPDAGWSIPDEGRPLTDANGAIPWIVFERDRAVFEREFPRLEILELRPHTPIRYLLSGGVSQRQLLPAFSYGPLALLERALRPLNRYLGMFQTIVLERRNAK